MPRATRVAAIGLWTLAGAWSSDHLKDGFVPGYMVEDLGGSEELAGVLIEAKLWTKLRDGYRFRNWSKWQQTREEVEKKRQAATDRVRKHRDSKAVNTGESNDGVTRYKNEVTPPPVPVPVPTQPNPKNNQSIAELTSEVPGTGLTVSNSVESVDNDLARIAQHVAELTGRECHPIEAGGIRTHYLDRAKTFPKLPTRFVLTCLTREEPLVLLNYLDTGRWSE